MKVILSHMYESRNESNALEKWKSKFASDMITTENCLDVVLFLNDCYDSIHFIPDLKKLASFYIIEYWPIVMRTRRWNKIRSEPNSLIRIFQMLRFEFESLIASGSGRDLVEVSFFRAKYGDLDVSKIRFSSEMGLIKVFFDFDLILLHKFWTKRRLDFKTATLKRPRIVNLDHDGFFEVKKASSTIARNCCQQDSFDTFANERFFAAIVAFVILVVCCVIVEVWNEFSNPEPEVVPSPLLDRCVCSLKNQSERFCNKFYFWLINVQLSVQRLFNYS